MLYISHKIPNLLDSQSFSVRFADDFDGCIKMTVELAPTSAPVRSLALRVPLRMSRFEANLMHSVTDQIRIHYAGSIPTGEVRPRMIMMMTDRIVMVVDGD